VNVNEQDKGYELVKYKVNKTFEESTEYTLTITVPQEITHDFTSEVYLIHPTTNLKTVIPLTFENKVRSSFAKVGSRLKTYEQREERGESTSRTVPAGDSRKDKIASGWMQYLLIGVFGIALICFVLVNFLKIDPIVRIKYIF